MSLKVLIDTVTTRAGLTDEDAFEQIHLFQDIVGTSDFTKRTLLAHRFNPALVETVLGALEDLNLIEVTGYEYDCLTSGTHGEVDTLSDSCIGCRKQIATSVDIHDISEIQCLNTGLVNEINEFEKAQIKEHLIDGGYQVYSMLQNSRNNIVPLLGAGVSVAWGIPTWGGLLKTLIDDVYGEDNQSRYLDLMERGDYLKALSLLLRTSFTITNDDQLRTRIANTITNYGSHSEPRLHNYEDILSLRSNFILTTNYDTTLSNYARERLNNPLCLSDIEDVQTLMLGHQRRVIHIHGIYDRPKTMIVSHQDYESLYKSSSQEFQKKMASIMGTKSLLFIGFSFGDEYFQEMYRDLTQILGREHYLVTANPVLFDVQEAAKIGLRVIGLRVSKNSDGTLDNNSYTVALSRVLRGLA